MAFTRGFKIILNKSDGNISEVNLKDGITLYAKDKKEDIIYKKQLEDGKFTLLDCNFDIDKADNIYGLINDNKGSLNYIFISDEIIVKERILKYNLSSSSIKYPYIKRFNGRSDIIYYNLNFDDPYMATIVHYHNNNGIWIKSEVDYIKYEILTDFNVVYDEDSLTIFYFNIIDNSVELFASKYDFETGLWSAPIQITNTKTSKVYLSVIRDENSIYHIVFSENNMYRYKCRYINVSINEEEAIINKSYILSDTIACEFPCVVEFNKRIHVFWCEYGNLYLTLSKTNGEIWTRPSIVQSYQNHDFLRAIFRSNDKNIVDIKSNIIYQKENIIDIYNFFSNIKAVW